MTQLAREHQQCAAMLPSLLATYLVYHFFNDLLVFSKGLFWQRHIFFQQCSELLHSQSAAARSDIESCILMPLEEL